MYQFDLETKRQSSFSIFPDEQPLQKFLLVRSVGTDRKRSHVFLGERAI